MLSKKLYFIFGLGTIITVLAVVLLIEENQYYQRWLAAVIIIPLVVSLVATYIFSPQIDWWWYQKYPPELATPFSSMLMNYFPFYQKLNAENKTRFRRRTQMYKEARGFYGKLGGDDDPVPEDIKTIIAANAVMLTFGKKDFILEPFERVFIYMQAFPSPQFPEYFHSSEISEEDSCLIFSAEHINFSFQHSKKFYNIVLHEYAKVFQLVNKELEYPDFDEKLWSGFSKEAVLKFMGLPDVEAFPVSINFFFYYPNKFKEVLPDIFQQYKNIFNLDPSNSSDPVIDKEVISKVV